MKLFLLSFLSLIAVAATIDIPLNEELARALAESGLQDQITRAIRESRALRGNRDPMEMSPEERSREASILCTTITSVIPANVMTCKCTDELLNGKLNFDCMHAKIRCLAAGPIGKVCTMTRTIGSVLVKALDLTGAVSLKGCGIQNTVTAAGTTYPVVDVCFNVDATVGVGGTGIKSCGVALGNRTCSSCTDCNRGNSSGIGFNCGGSINFCLPINLPIFVGKPALKGTTLEKVINIKVLDDAALALVAIVAQQQQVAPAPPQAPAPKKQNGN